MDAEIEDWTSPKLEAIEDELAKNYREFQARAMEWGREWQRGINRRAMARKRAQAKENGTPHEQDAA